MGELVVAMNERLQQQALKSWNEQQAAAAAQADEEEDQE
jgi:hypothetical protein